jgi:carbonyl reductase 1
LALCKKLAKDHGAQVFLGSRNAERGAAAVQQVKDYAGSGANVALVVVDVSSDDSVKSAAAALTKQGVTLSAIVNNAGTGLCHGVTGQDIMNVNLMGPKRVVDAFGPLLSSSARIVNVGSGSGPLYVAKQSQERQKRLCNPDISWDEIEELYKVGVTPEDPAAESGFLKEYGLSKALLSCFTMMLAARNKNILAFCLSPGYIDTNLTKDWPGGKSPEEATVSILHCLFEATEESSGWFYGSDGKRSPLHFLRNPGEPIFDGSLPWDA